MQNNLSSFFKNMQTNSPLKRKLSITTTTLDELLDDEKLVQQFCASNPQLLSFFDYEKIKQLVQYVTKVGSPQNKKKAYKFPLVSSEILSSGNPHIIKFFFPEQQLFKYETIENGSMNPQKDSGGCRQKDEKMKNTNKQQIQSPAVRINGGQHVIKQINSPNRLMKAKTKILKKFLQPLINDLFTYFDGQLNYTLAGYVSKVLLSFLIQKPHQLIQFCINNTQNYQRLTAHIQSISIAEFISNLLAHNSHSQIQSRTRCIYQLINQLGNSKQQLRKHGISHCLCQIFVELDKCDKDVKKIFMSSQIMVSICQQFMSQSSFCPHLNAILQKYLSYRLNSMTENDEEQDRDQLCTKLSAILKAAVQNFKNLIMRSKTIGLGGLKFLQSLYLLLKHNISNFVKILNEQDSFVETLIGLIKKYECNNILHQQIFKILQLGIFDTNLATILNKDNIIVNFLVGQWKEKGNKKRSYMGFVVGLLWGMKKCYTCHLQLQHLNIYNDGQDFIEVINNQVIGSFLPNLGGYTKSQSLPSSFVFSKSQILQKYSHFLPKTTQGPPYQPQSDIQPVSSFLRKRNSEENEYIGQYWVIHLSYDIDQLLKDL